MSAHAKNAITLALIIPAYNEENHIRACLESIARQSMLPDEVIVVDNNSTDNTARIAAAFPFVTIISESEQGIVFARDAGFNAARGDIIARIDADTVLPAGWIKRVHTYYAEPKNATTSLTGGGYFYNVRLRRFNGWLQSQLAFRLNKVILGHNILWGSNMAMPRTLWAEVKPKLCIRDDIHEDLDLAIHLHRLGYAIDYQPSLKVGVKLKRVYSNRQLLRGHMARWPKTLHIHHYKLWWMGVAGNIFSWYILQPLLFTLEYASRLLHRKPLND